MLTLAKLESAHSLQQKLNLLGELGLMTRKSQLESENGPVSLFIQVDRGFAEPTAQKVFAIAAIFAQRGNVLNTFRAVSEEGTTEETVGLNPLKKFQKDPRVENNRALHAAFGMFVVSCWKRALTAFDEGLNTLTPSQMLASGSFQTIHEGGDGGAVEDILAKLPVSEERCFDELGDPYFSFHEGLHVLSSLLLGRGYQPGTVGNYEAREKLAPRLKNDSTPWGDVCWMNILLHAAQTGDPRLKPYFL